MPRPSAESTADEKCTNSDWDGESDKGGNGGNAKNGTDGDDATKYQQCQADADDGVKPDSVDGSLSMLVDPLPDAGKRKAIITGVCVCDSTSSHHAALPHAVAANDGETEDCEGGLLWHNLEEVCGPWLAEIRVDHGADIDHGICSDKLEEPTEEPTEARCHDDSAGRGDAGIAAFFRQMKRGVVARHGPNDGNEGHEDGHTRREVGARINGTPDVRGFGEAWQILICPVGVCRDKYDDNDESDDVEGASVRVEVSYPAGGHARDDTVAEHDQGGKQEDLVVLRRVRWIAN